MSDYQRRERAVTAVKFTDSAPSPDSVGRTTGYLWQHSAKAPDGRDLRTIIHEGDWIVFDPVVGYERVVTDSDFHRLYQEVPSPFTIEDLAATIGHHSTRLEAAVRDVAAAIRGPIDPMHDVPRGFGSLG